MRAIGSISRDNLVDKQRYKRKCTNKIHPTFRNCLSPEVDPGDVDDFDEAFEFLSEKGFTNPTGRAVENKYSRSAMVKSPSGFAFDLCQHIKDHD